MRVCLINPPSPFLEEQNIQPPLGLLYIAAMFERHGQEVTVLDYGTKDYGVPEGYDLYGFSATTPQYPYAVELAKKIDGYKVIGGPHVTSVDADRSLWDVVVRGEGEQAVSILVRYAEKGAKGVIRDLLPINDLDSIPFPARHLVDLNDYVREVDGKKATVLITSRGCPFGCVFCDSEMWGRKVRRRSVENVMAEIDHLKERYGYQAFLFLDDSFTLNRKWVLEFCERIKRRNVVFRCWTRVDLVDKKMLKSMVEAGCVQLGFGIESGSDKILKSMNKGTTVEQGRKATKLTKDAGIEVKFFLVGGSPFETVETVVETVRFIEETDPDAWGLGTLTPVPGSMMWEYPEKFGIKEINKDLKQMYMVGHGGKGGLSFVPANGTAEDLMALRDVLLNYLKGR
jgi:anaerobic magnesium-protoporphyrin IX monomethyl ester cyclase